MERSQGDVMGHVAFRFVHPPTIDWQILDSSLIVVANLLSQEVTLRYEDDEDHPYYEPMHVLKFQVLDYLKGSGPSELTIEIPRAWDSPLERGLTWDWEIYDWLDKKQVLEAGKLTLELRSAEWDDRPAVIFLEGPYKSVSMNESQEAVYMLTNNNMLNQTSFAYSIDTLSRAWLPADDGTDRAFIVDGKSEPYPVIKEEDLQARINEIQAMLDGGDGSQEYINCVTSKLQSPWYFTNRKAISPRVATISSGAPAGTEIGRYERDGPPDPNVKWYFTGEGSNLFEVSREGSNDYYRTARPLIGGLYKLRKHAQHEQHKICGYRRTYDDPGYTPWNVTVENPQKTLHEAYFDPNETNHDEIYPNKIDLYGMPIEIEGLEWIDGKVTLTLNEHAHFNGQLEIIGFDGSTRLALRFTDSIYDADANKFSWAVEEQPWEEGEELMLRIWTPEPEPNLPYSPSPTNVEAKIVRLNDYEEGKDYQTCDVRISWDGDSSGIRLFNVFLKQGIGTYEHLGSVEVSPGRAIGPITSKIEGLWFFCYIWRSFDRRRHNLCERYRGNHRRNAETWCGKFTQK